MRRFPTPARRATTRFSPSDRARIPPPPRFQTSQDRQSRDEETGRWNDRSPTPPPPTTTSRRLPSQDRFNSTRASYLPHRRTNLYENDDGEDASKWRQRALFGDEQPQSKKHVNRTSRDDDFVRFDGLGTQQPIERAFIGGRDRPSSQFDSSSRPTPRGYPPRGDRFSLPNSSSSSHRRRSTPSTFADEMREAETEGGDDGRPRRQEFVDHRQRNEPPIRPRRQDGRLTPPGTIGGTPPRRSSRPPPPTTDEFVDEAHDALSSARRHASPSRKTSQDEKIRSPPRDPHTSFLPLTDLPTKLVISDPTSHEFLYGKHAVEAALSVKSRSEMVRLLVQNTHEEGNKDAIVKLANTAGIKVELTTKAMLNDAVENRPHQGYVLETSLLSPQLLKRGELIPNLLPMSTVLALDEVADAMNLGAICRTAYYLGIHAIITTRKNSAPFIAHVAKTSAGTIDYLAAEGKLFCTDNMVDCLAAHSAAQVNVVGAMAKATDSVPLRSYKRDEQKPLIVVMGNEETGLRTNVARKCDSFVHYPQPSHVVEPTLSRASKSVLNVSVATAIILHDLVHVMEGDASPPVVVVPVETTTTTTTNDNAVVDVTTNTADSDGMDSD